jgi:two-component system, OmpR family, sensor histidine kinase KdpD
MTSWLRPTMADSRAVDVGRSDDDIDQFDRIRRGLRRVGPDVLVAAAALAAGAVVVAVLERMAGIDNAAAVFLLAVVIVAVRRGTGPAIATAVGAFLVYDFLFVQPYYTLTVADPNEWLNLVLLLIVGVVVGRLAGRERDRAVAAIERQREALALFNVSFTLANERAPAAALPAIARMLGEDVRATRVWVVVGETVAADTASSGGGPPRHPAVHATLRRRPGDEPAEWVRVHARTPTQKPTGSHADTAYRVTISAGGQTLGAIWAIRPRGLGDPSQGETRVLAAAADQIGGSLERERLQREATTAEVSRRSDALKSALLDSVSHDLRTPLASIRAAAGTLMDPEIDWPPAQRREIAASIDREADWLNRLVTNLLDMSRIEAGELKANLAAFELADLVERAVQRFEAAQAGRRVEVDLPPDLPPVLADEVFIGQVLANILDNSAKYAGPGAPISISALQLDGDTVRLTIEDGGAGVPADALPRLFEKFYRVPRRGEGSRRGTGIGLSVVRGMVDALGGSVTAHQGSLGGLAIDVDLRAAGGQPGNDRR